MQTAHIVREGTHDVLDVLGPSNFWPHQRKRPSIAYWSAEFRPIFPCHFTASRANRQPEFV